ncbi:MAG: acetate--CoA ligase family protein [Promethearchaeota archaeon]
MPRGERYVLEPEAVHLLQQYGILYPAHGFARDADEAAGIAQELGFPVVLKIVSPDITHKSDAGGVVVGIKEAEEVRSAYKRILDCVRSAVPKVRIEGVLVCEQAPDGLEVIVGALNDVSFGPTVMFGLGGIFTEVLQDVSFRVAPLRRSDAEEMIREIRGYPLLGRARGKAPLDVEGLVKLLLSVSQLVTERGETQEFDLNPVRVYEDGLLALDARWVVKAGGGSQ